MAFSKVSIINDALTHLGADRITSLADTSTEAAVMNQLFEGVRDSVMRAFPWNSLMNRAQLAKSTTTPAFGYENKFALPTDPYCLRVMEMDETTSTDQWKVEGRFLLTDAATCKIRYIGRPDDVGDLDPLLAAAISARLAADACYSLVQSNTVLNSMWSLYQAKLDEAKSVDNVESSRDYWVNTRLESVRAAGNVDSTRFGRAWW